VVREVRARDSIVHRYGILAAREPQVNAGFLSIFVATMMPSGERAAKHPQPSAENASGTIPFMTFVAA
jgi:hypothetical protein